jgi:hypothetical protein
MNIDCQQQCSFAIDEEGLYRSTQVNLGHKKREVEGGASRHHAYDPNSMNLFNSDA